MNEKKEEDDSEDVIEFTFGYEEEQGKPKRRLEDMVGSMMEPCMT